MKFIITNNPQKHINPLRVFITQYYTGKPQFLIAARSEKEVQGYTTYPVYKTNPEFKHMFTTVCGTVVLSGDTLAKLDQTGLIAVSNSPDTPWIPLIQLDIGY